MNKDKIEYRQLDLQTMVNHSNNKDENEYIIEGKAISFDFPEVLYRDRFGNEYSEQICSTALTDVDLSNVALVYNHEAGKAKNLARIKNKTLSLELKDDGLYFRAKLKTNLGKDVYQSILDGEVSKCSFGFICEEEQFDDNINLRSVLKIKKLIDISIVDEPAYDKTFVCCRDSFKAKEEILKRQAYEQERNNLLLMLS